MKRIPKDVVKVIANNFSKFPENVRNELLLKLSEKDKAAKDVAKVIANNFSKFPENVRNELLLKLSEKDKAAKDVAKIIANNFSKFPENVRNELLLKLSEKDKPAKNVAKIIANNFDKFPENVRNELLLKLSEKNKAANDLRGCTVHGHSLRLQEDGTMFDMLDRRRLECGVIVSDKDQVGVPIDRKVKLGKPMSEAEAAKRNTICAVKDNFDKLPEDLRNELLPNVSEKDSDLEFVEIAETDVIKFEKTLLESNLKENRNYITESEKKEEIIPSYIEKYSDIDFHSSINLNQRYPLTIRLLTEKIEKTIDDMIIVFGFVEGIEEIEVHVTLDAKDFEIENSEQKIKVPLRKNSESFVFYLTPKSIGKKKLRLKFYQKENYNGEILIETTVHKQEETEEVSSNVVQKGEIGINLIKERSEDLLIEVELLDNYLEYRVTSRILGLFTNKYHSDKPLHDPRQFVNNILKELSDISSASYSDVVKYENIISKIETIGMDLYNKLIPEELKRIIWINTDKISSIFIVTDEEWIPWEIMKPFRINENNDTEVEDFWCRKYIISRWVSGHFPRELISIKKSTIIANDFKGKLKNVINEKENIETILRSKNIEIIQTKPERLEILDLLSDKIVNLLHFACEGTYRELYPDDSYIQLLDYELKAKDVSVKNLRKAKPLIFMNACQSGRTDYTYSGIGGFAKAFLDIGALAFIGTIWKIPDELSMKFSDEFYRNIFEKGMSLGESLRETKRNLSTLNNPAWLAYSLYSFPLTRITI